MKLRVKPAACQDGGMGAPRLLRIPNRGHLPRRDQNGRSSARSKPARPAVITQASPAYRAQVIDRGIINKSTVVQKVLRTGPIKAGVTDRAAEAWSTAHVPRPSRTSVAKTVEYVPLRKAPNFQKRPNPAASHQKPTLVPCRKADLNPPACVAPFRPSERSAGIHRADKTGSRRSRGPVWEAVPPSLRPRRDGSRAGCGSSGSRSRPW